MKEACGHTFIFLSFFSKFGFVCCPLCIPALEEEKEKGKRKERERVENQEIEAEIAKIEEKETEEREKEHEKAGKSKENINLRQGERERRGVGEERVRERENEREAGRGERLVGRVPARGQHMAGGLVAGHHLHELCGKENTHFTTLIAYRGS